MFMNAPRTAYDLHFQMFRIPIRVHPSFWLVGAIFCWDLVEKGFAFLLLGIACVFVTILIHELGHALMWRAYHMDSVILLYSFGGLTYPEGRLPRRSWRIIVTLAGPFSNFLLFGIVWGSDVLRPWSLVNDYTWTAYFILCQINLVWGLINLLPVYPLDGGQISRELWLQFQPRMGIVNSLRMSMIIAIAFAAYALACRFHLIPVEWMIVWLQPGIYGAILFGVLALQNYLELQKEFRPTFYDDDSRWR